MSASKRWRLPLFSGQELGAQTDQTIPPPIPPIPGVCTLPGMVLWLDSVQVSTVRHNSNRVYQWLDRSGSGNHATQEVASLQPTRVLGQGIKV